MTAQKKMAKLAELKNEVELFEGIEEEVDNLNILNELALSEKDELLSVEIHGLIDDLEKKFVRLEERQWFTTPTDANDAIVTIHPGAGGTESQDWANMLLRMYLRWAEKQGFNVILNEVSSEEEAGIKSATITIKGPYANGLLQAERGVHRLVRISPFDAGKRRHTSFASVDVIPVVDDSISINIEPKDLRIETYRSSGAGGQHVNVTDSAVRIIHQPTGVVVQCQNERSQLQNKEAALKILKSRLYERELEARETKQEAARGQKRDIAWGSQIRSYVLHPYTLVKDHRTGEEKGNAQAVLDGALDPFIQAWHRWRLTPSEN